MGLETSRNVLATLECMFVTIYHARVINMLFQLSTLKKGPSIQNYFQKAIYFSDVLSAISQPIGEHELISCILAYLPMEYDSH